jgi:hypothetical protein
MRSGGPTFDPGAPPFWQSIDLSPAFRQVTAFLAAIALGVLTFFGMLSVFREHGWQSEAIVGVVVAVVWMATGAALSRAHPVTCVLLLIIGSAASRYLAYGIMAQVSILHGMTTYLSATMFGGAAWLVIARIRKQRIMWPILGMLVVAGVQVARVTVFEMPGVPETLYYDNNAEAVGVLPRIASDGSTYVWQTNGAKLGRGLDSMTASVDLSGSGPSRHSLTRVTDAAEKSSACHRLATTARERIDGEIAAGTTASFVRMIPLRQWNCDAGTMWRVE